MDRAAKFCLPDLNHVQDLGEGLARVGGSAEKAVGVRSIADDEFIDNVFNSLAPWPHDRHQRNSIAQAPLNEIIEEGLVREWRVQDNFGREGHGLTVGRASKVRYPPVAEVGGAPHHDVMTLQELEALDVLEQAASVGPWFVRRLDDELCMGALTVSTRPDTGKNEGMRAGSWPGAEIVAACLIQSPPYVVPNDDKEEENARLIAAARNALPELIRLAKLGLGSDR